MSYMGLSDFTIPGDPTIHPGCDPLDAACVDAMLRTQSARLCPPGTDQSHCYGNPGYDAYVQSQDDAYAKQIASGPQPVYTLPNGQVARNMDEYRAAWSGGGQNKQTSDLVARQVAAGMTIIPQDVPIYKMADSAQPGSQRMSEETSGGYISSSPIVVGGFDIPWWMLAAGGVGLFLLATGR